MTYGLELKDRWGPDSDAERAMEVFAGSILIYRSVPAMHDLIRHLRKHTSDIMAPYDPPGAESALGAKEFLSRAMSARKIVSNDPETGCRYRALFEELGTDIRFLYWDHLKLRFQPSNPKSRSRYIQNLPPHRDTWGSNIHAQINWWAPVWSVTTDRTIAIFPTFWNRPIENTSSDWSYHKFRKFFQKNRQTKYPMLPQCASTPSLTHAVPIVIEPGDIMAFSGAHLHASTKNRSGVVRISTETRTVSMLDLDARRAAPNIDCETVDSRPEWFHNLETGQELFIEIDGDF